MPLIFTLTASFSDRVSCSGKRESWFVFFLAVFALGSWTIFSMSRTVRSWSRIFLRRIICISSESTAKRARAWPSEISLASMASWMVSESWSRRRLLVMAARLFPKRSPTSWWDILNSSARRLKALARSMGVSSFLSRFSTRASSSDSLSESSLTMAEIIVIPVRMQARKRLSPATSSYPSPFFLTIMGWARPWVLIERASSLMSLLSKDKRGWNSFATMDDVGIWVIVFPEDMKVLGIRASRPLPSRGISELDTGHYLLG